MANVRDSDTSLWLHNKLGTSNDSWTGGSICSQLNAEVLRNIKDCFPDLQTQVKLKLLLSFFHIPRRNVEEWRLELEEIIEVAAMDSESWVSMLAEAMKTLPARGSLNTEISHLEVVRPIFTDLVSDLRKLVKKQSESGMLPMECHYLNKNALISMVGQQPVPTKHFSLKKQPKSAYLRAELLQKSNDAASNLKKASAPVVPVRSRGMPRKMTDTTPLKGIPSRVPSSGFRSGTLNNSTNRPIPRTPAGRKDGGIKLLDIADQPLGYAAAKKRKRMQEIEDAKKLTEQTGLQSPPTNGTTPDYAAGLPSTTSYQPSTPQPSTSLRDGPSTPLGVPSSLSSTPGSTSSAYSTTPTPPVPTIQTVVTANPAAKTMTLPPLVPSSQPVLQQQQQHQQQAAEVSATAATAVATAAAGGNAAKTTSLVSGGILSNQTVTVVSQRPVQQVTQIRLQPPANTNPTQRKGLALTREQMLEAQDMFRTANKVTRPEKALILGFMAGSRENPCPHLGNIVTIKLSEDQENVMQGDSTFLTMMVETHFQMNYNNGEWKRIKKFRQIENLNTTGEQITAHNATAATGLM